MIKLFIFREPRDESNLQTLGKLYVVDLGKNQIIFQCSTLELGWHRNETNASCIPAGKYSVTKRYTTNSKFKYEHLEIHNVPNRTSILIHIANYYHDLLGCIAVGSGRFDIDKDGMVDVTNSRDTLNRLLEVLPDEFTLEIFDTEDTSNY